MCVWISSNNSRPSVSGRASILHYCECERPSTKQYYAPDQSLFDFSPGRKIQCGTEIDSKSDVEYVILTAIALLSQNNLEKHTTHRHTCKKRVMLVIYNCQFFGFSAKFREF